MIINDTFKQIELKDLDEGKIICDKCKGKILTVKKIINRYIECVEVCGKCNGKGYVDWLENIINNDNENSICYEYRLRFNPPPNNINFNISFNDIEFIKKDKQKC